MKPFRFTLQALLTVREREERAAFELYARTLQLRQQAFDDLTAVESDLAAARVELRHQMVKGGPVAGLLQRQSHCHQLGEQREPLADALARAEKAARLALLHMITAQQNREVVDKFLETQQKNYQRDCTREEQKLLDELAHCAGPASPFTQLNPEPAWN